MFLNKFELICDIMNEEIFAQAKQILDSFYEALAKTTIESEDFGVLSPIQTRDSQMVNQSEDFTLKILQNAPQKNVEYIIAEKKHW